MGRTFSIDKTLQNNIKSFSKAAATLLSNAMPNNCNFSKNYYSTIYKLDLFNHDHFPLQIFISGMGT